MSLEKEKLHFNVIIQQRKYSLKLQRDEFAPISAKPSLPPFKKLINEGAYIDDSYAEYSIEWCEKYRKLCLENYDLNMAYFNSLNAEEFKVELDHYIKRNRGFKEIFDLNKFDGVSGYYIMVIGEYKQVYIGKAVDIKRRIRQHWNKTKPLDRTLFPMYNVEGSVFSIDFFRALDTTQIFIWKKALSDGLERRLINDFPSKFLCNRIGGDVTNCLEALATKNIRILDKE